MGRQTCAVLLGFIFIHVALILSLIAISSHEWVHASPHNATVENSTGLQGCDKGLWQLCCEECQPINSTVERKYFRACQGLEVVSTGFLGLAVFLLYIFLCGSRMNDSGTFAALIAFCVVVAAFAFLTVLIILGVHYQDSLQFPTGFDLKLGWSYYVGVAGTVFTFLSTLTTGSEAFLLRNRVAGYENI